MKNASGTFTTAIGTDVSAGLNAAASYFAFSIHPFAPLTCMTAGVRKYLFIQISAFSTGTDYGTDCMSITYLTTGSCAYSTNGFSSTAVKNITFNNFT